MVVGAAEEPEWLLAGETLFATRNISLRVSWLSNFLISLLIKVDDYQAQASGLIYENGGKYFKM